MAKSDLDILVDLKIRNKRQFDRQIQRLSNSKVSVDTKRGEQALGRITGRADEFTKSLEASNARVIAFGASVAVIEGVRRSFVKLIKTITEVESSLTAINSILGQSSGGIKKFGDELFQIAKNTGQSFKEAADTAQEFARQGLSVEKTLQRTNDALILTRLTTLKTDEAVSALTATLNGFEKQALTSSEVINKLRAVETSFAVSSGDLADALARSASVAQGAGVSFEELLGVITAIKQRTGLGGATIGQGLKTVFTRLNLPTRIQQLKDLGVNINENASGLEKLRQVSVAVRQAQDSGNASLATQIGAIAAGQFQISKLSAAFSDLSSSYSVADAATRKAVGATNEAIIANQLYNETIQSLKNSIDQNIGSILSKIGELGGQDAIKDFLKDVNSILEAFKGNDVAASKELVDVFNAGIRAAKDWGILSDAAKGFINVLKGPGLITIAAIIGNLFKNTAKQVIGVITNLSGINNKLQKRAQIEKAILELKRQATQEELEELSLATSQQQKETVILRLLERQLAVQKALNAENIGVATGLMGRGVKANGGIFTKGAKGKSFASGNVVLDEQRDIKSGVGGASPNAQARVITKFNYGNGKVGPAVVNTEEVVIPSDKGDLVLTKDMMRQMGHFASGKIPKSLDTIEAKIRLGNPLTPRQMDFLERYAGNNPPSAAAAGKIKGSLAGAIREAGGIDSVKSKVPAYGKVPYIDNQGRKQTKYYQQDALKAPRSTTPAPKVKPSSGGSALAIEMLSEQENLKNGSKGLRPAQGSQGISYDSSERIKVAEKQKRFFETGRGSKVTKGTIFNEIVDKQVAEYGKSIGDDSLSAKKLSMDRSGEGRKVLARIKKEARKDVNAISRQARESAQKAYFEGSGKAVGKKINKLEAKKNRPNIWNRKFGERKPLSPEQKGRRAAMGNRMQTGAFAGSFALSMAAPSIERNFGSKAGGAASGAAMGMGMGAMLGPMGALVGGVGGGIAGALMAKGDDPAENLKKSLEELKENFNNVSNSANSYMQTQSKLSAMFEAGGYDAKQVGALTKESNKFLKEVSSKNPELAKKMSRAENQEDRSKIFQEFQDSESNNIERKERGLLLNNLSTSKDSKLGRYAGYLDEGLGAGIGKNGLLRTFAGDVAGANQATFSTEDVNQIQDTILADIDMDALNAKLEKEGKTMGEFFQDMARTTKGFDGKEFEVFMKELGVSEEVAQSLRDFRAKFGDLGDSVVSQALGTGLRDKGQDLQETMALNEISLRAMAAKQNFGETALRKTKIQRGRFENTRLAERATRDLGYQSDEVAIQKASVFGRDTSKQQNELESAKLETSIGRRYDDLKDTAAQQFRSVIEPIMKDGGGTGDLSEQLDRLASGDMSVLGDIKESLKDNPESIKKLTAMVDGIAHQSDQLQVIADQERQSLKIQQEAKAAIKSLQGFKNRTEERLGQSVKSLFGQDDETIAGRVKNKVGLTKEEREDALEDPNSNINKYLRDGATQARGGAEAYISSLPEEFQDKARMTYERNLELSTQDPRRGGGGFEMSNFADRSKFSVQKVMDLVKTMGPLGMTDEKRSQVQAGGEELLTALAEQKEAFKQGLSDTAFRDIFGEPTKEKDRGVESEGKSTEKGFGLSQALLANATAQKKSIIEQENLAKKIQATVKDQAELVKKLQDIAGNMAKIAEQTATTNLNLDNQIRLTITNEETDITTNIDFATMEEALEALDSRVKNLTRKLQGLEALPDE